MCRVNSSADSGPKDSTGNFFPDPLRADEQQNPERRHDVDARSRHGRMIFGQFRQLADNGPQNRRPREHLLVAHLIEYGGGRDHFPAHQARRPRWMTQAPTAPARGAR